jgi:hypothetical protein
MTALETDPDGKLEGAFPEPVGSFREQPSSGTDFRGGVASAEAAGR